MVQLDFLVPGYNKGGTTTLCALLAQHPQLFLHPDKETWYFSSEDFGRWDDVYDANFETVEAGQLLGEGSVSYSGDDHEAVTVPRLHRNNPNMRILFIARHPLRRIEPSYREMHHSGPRFGFNAPYDLREALAFFPQFIAASRLANRMMIDLEENHSPSMTSVLSPVTANT